MINLRATMALRLGGMARRNSHTRRAFWHPDAFPSRRSLLTQHAFDDPVQIIVELRRELMPNRVLPLLELESLAGRVSFNLTGGFYDQDA